ncbi:MAG: hypothetical protein AAFQ68_13240, partial [Bacteroidota bacterium]
MRPFWLLCLLLLPALLPAQQKQLVFYRIPAAQIEQSLLEKKFQFDPYQLEDVYTTLPTTYQYYEYYFRDTVPRGYYLLASLDDQTETFHFHHHTDFRSVELRRLFEERYLYVPNDRYPQDSLEVRIDGESLPFDRELRLFRLGERTKSGILSISSPAETAHFRFEIEKEKGFVISEINTMSRSVKQEKRSAKPAEAKRLLRIGYKKWYFLEQSQGYLALNQPLYRPGDTIKLKAHILDAKAQGLQHTLSLVLSNQYGGSRISLGSVSPSRAGIYLHEFVLGDSLRIDQSYQLFLEGENDRRLVQNEFKLEDYLLDEYKFEFWQDSTYNLLSDSCVMMMRARTENGMPVPEVQVFLQIKPSRVIEAPETLQYLPMMLLDTLIDLPNDGLLRLSLPAERFASFACQYELEARFLAPNAEQSVLTRYYARLSQQRAKQTYSFPNTSRPKLEAGGQQSQDSAYLYLHNPNQELLIYRLFREHELVEQGYTQDSLHWEKSQKRAHLWRVEWKRHDKSYPESFSLAPKEYLLDIAIEQPDTIKPGQQVKAKLKVRDHLGQPVPNTELTFWGVNAQFRRSNLPELPYFGPRMLERTESQKVELEKASDRPFEKTWWLKAERAEQLGLMAQDYYRLHYPDSILFQYQAIEDTG